eukprot:INCI3981.3.p2 GENE.INCI3981.3~~INCI3981.3.p2  ORF type:complete len:129 (+),score=31.69 INCI3981.3:29-388(+)
MQHRLSITLCCPGKRQADEKAAADRVAAEEKAEEEPKREGSKAAKNYSAQPGHVDASKRSESSNVAEEKSSQQSPEAQHRRQRMEAKLRTPEEKAAHDVSGKRASRNQVVPHPAGAGSP